MLLSRAFLGLFLLLQGCVFVKPAEPPVENDQHVLNLHLNDQFDLITLMRSSETGMFPFQGVKWHTNGYNVVKVNSDTGLIYAKSAGVCIITARIPKVGLDMPEHIVQFYVTVSPTPRVTAKKIEIAPAAMTAYVGERWTPHAWVYLNNGEINSNVLWYSSDMTIATVDSDTGEIHAIRAGATTITAVYTQDYAILKTMLLKVYTGSRCNKKQKVDDVIKHNSDCMIVPAQRAQS
jgi:hypothetical protein